MKGLIINCEVLYVATFRKPSSTSLILSYLIPPFTTVRGMIANALGLQQHDHTLQGKIKIGLRLVHPGYKNFEMVKILKLKESTMPLSRSYPSSPMFKEFLVNPKYEFFIGGDEVIITEIRKSLFNLKRPLYLGQSDDLIDLQVSEVIDIYEKEANEFHSVVEGIHAGCAIEKLPFAFNEDNGKYSLEYKLVSIPQNELTVTKISKGFVFNNFTVELF